MYGNMVLDSANNGTEATEEPTKLLSVSMPLDMFKRAITQCVLSVLRFVKNLYINLLVVYFCSLTYHCSQCLQEFFWILCFCGWLGKFWFGCLLWLCLLFESKTRWPGQDEYSLLEWSKERKLGVFSLMYLSMLDTPGKFACISCWWSFCGFSSWSQLVEGCWCLSRCELTWACCWI